MVFVPAWPPVAAAKSLPHAVRMGANASVREQNARPTAIERLRRHSDFRAVAEGARASGRNFVLQARSRADEQGVRLGFTVSRQVGNAVERNRVRRRLREIVRLSASTGAGRFEPGFDYVVIGRRAALAAEFGDMVQEFDAAFGQLRSRGGKQGTGSASRDPLHQAHSPSQRPESKSQRPKSSGSRRQKPPKPPELPPRER